IPRSRSRSIESRTCSRICRGSTVLVISRMRSASVDFPWSMWAMIEKFRMCAWSAIRRSNLGACGRTAHQPVHEAGHPALGVDRALAARAAALGDEAVDPGQLVLAAQLARPRLGERERLGEHRAERPQASLLVGQRGLHAVA